jgi:hypothetical protein
MAEAGINILHKHKLAVFAYNAPEARQPFPLFHTTKERLE